MLRLQFRANPFRFSKPLRDTQEFKTLRKYIQNTEQNALSGKYITNIYHLQRKGEPERFQKWESLHNHQLLFHGSALSNYVGILSQGLRIAPPEAPVSGYAFGKGIYFADMFQKSFQYCRMGWDYDSEGNRKRQVIFLSSFALNQLY